MKVIRDVRVAISLCISRLFLACYLELERQVLINILNILCILRLIKTNLYLGSWLNETLRIG